MPSENVRDNLKTAIQLGLPEKPLVLPIALDQFAARYAGIRYDDYATQPEKIAYVWNKVIQDFDLDWAGIFIDDLFEYEPLGIELSRSADLPFAVSKYLAPLEETVAKLHVPDPAKAGRMPARLKANNLLREKWGQRILINGNIAAPFTGLTLLYGISNVMMQLYDNPGVLIQTMDFLENLAIIWGRALIKSGVDTIWLGECVGSSNFISHDMYREFALGPAKRVVKALKEEGSTVIYHACEKDMAYLLSMEEVGADILSVSSKADLVKIQNQLGRKTCLMGNLDPLALICNGTQEEIESEVEKLAKTAFSQGGLIINTDEGIPEQTPNENLMTFIRCIRKAIDFSSRKDR